jgi:enoyl-[acyl-carrier protein] reductase/trans-2-enoyl-CoA reductase (NAD+)
MDWMDALKAADAIEKDAVTVAFSYLGPEITHPIYMNGSIGQAKKHLYETSKAISAKYSDIKAYISVNKALVTQSSSAIPVVPLYISLLFRVMKKNRKQNIFVQEDGLFLHRRKGFNLKLQTQHIITTQITHQVTILIMRLRCY